MTATIRMLTGLCIGAATLCLAAAFVASSWWSSLAMLGIGLLWLSVLRHGNGRVADWGLFFFVLAAVWGGLQGLAWGWLLTAVVAGLAGWDLTHYLVHWQAAPERRGERELVRRHLLRLAGMAVGSWLLAGLTLFVTVRFNYLWALVLAGVAVFLLTRALRRLRSRGAA
ncbi:MAG: hypothetical protein HY328_01975 [Chloroflexi bacterium]|nr:hypothetical protein [Chloroflexota bacterium]